MLPALCDCRAKRTDILYCPDGWTLFIVDLMIVPNLIACPKPWTWIELVAQLIVVAEVDVIAIDLVVIV